MKGRVTLKLYADYIGRFYSSRGEDSDAVTVDTSSVESSPAIYRASPDTDLFSLGLDFLLVFRAVKGIRAAMGLKDQLAPLHLYLNPTIAKFSAALTRLAAERRLHRSGRLC